MPETLSYQIILTCPIAPDVKHIQFSGGRPDGLALTSDGGVVVCQTGMGLVWVHNALGQPIAVIRSPRGLGTTNCAFGGPEGRTIFITESDSGSILKAELPKDLGITGAPKFSCC